MTCKMERKRRPHALEPPVATALSGVVRQNDDETAEPLLFKPPAVCYDVNKRSFASDIRSGGRKPQERVMLWAEKDEDAQHRDAGGGGIYLFSEQFTDARVFRYHACSWANFADWYCVLPPERRTFFEILMTKRPVHWYGDIEFSQALNPALRLTDVVERVHTLAAALFEDAYSLNEARDGGRWLVYDSSCGDKQSAHVVFKWPGRCMFRCNRDAGAFMRMMLARERYGMGSESLLWTSNNHTDEELMAIGRLIQRQRSDPSVRVGFLDQPWHEDSEGRESALDRSVYTDNRPFRILGSVKANAIGNAERYLRPWGSSAVAGASGTVDREALLESLLCYTPPSERGVQLITFAEIDGSTSVSTTLAAWGRHKHSALTVSTPGSHAKRARVASTMDRDTDEETLLSEEDLCELLAAAEQLVNMEAGSTLYGSQKHRLFSHTRRLEVGVLSHECDILRQVQGRAHKNNNTYWLLDLVGGTYKRLCFHDGCREYVRRGSAQPIVRSIPDVVQQRIAAVVSRMREPTWAPEPLLRWTL